MLFPTIPGEIGGLWYWFSLLVWVYIYYIVTTLIVLVFTSLVDQVQIGG